MSWMPDQMPADLRKLDTVETSRVLLDADAIAVATGRAAEHIDGRKAVRLDLDSALTIAFVPLLTDLRAFDQLVLILHTAGGEIVPTLSIELATRTEGLPANDSLSSGPSQKLSFPDGWGQYPFPWENFHIFGMGELVNPIQKIELRFSPGKGPATVWLAELRVERRRRTQGPRLTARGLAQELDGFDGPGLLAHLRRRERPFHIYGNKPVKPVDLVVPLADEICRHFINGHDVGNPINWRINPNGYRGWRHVFNRHSWMNALMDAYRATGDPRYARKLDALWLSWLEDNPEPMGHNGGGDPAWSTLSTAVRIFGPWLDAFFTLLNEPHFRDSTRIEILKSLFGHAEHLLAHKGYANNWLIVESRVLFTLGLLFPEFKRASLWLQEGAHRLAAELEIQIWPDGADWELSCGYHMMACRGFLEPLELARLNGVTLPPIFVERLPTTFDYIAGMTRPDGSIPSVNDSGGWRKHNQSRSDYLAYGVRLFDRPELKASLEGPYAGTSRKFPAAGFHILASGTADQALWSFLDGGPPGASHCHEDALNVEFFAFGLPFVVDPGITGYMQDEWTTYYRKSQAHNTVLVNGASQDWVRQSHASRTTSARGRVYSAFGEVADVAHATYDHPYFEQPAGLAHTRTLLLIRGKYWVIFDEVRGEAAQNMEARFQFVPLRLTLDRRQRVFRTMRQSLPNMELWPLTPAGRLTMSIVTGKTQPVGGWVSDGEDQPAPQARIGVKRKDDHDYLRLVTVVYPFTKSTGSGLRVRLKPGQSEDSNQLEIRHASGTVDRMDYIWDEACWSNNGTSAEATPLVLKIEEQHCSLINGVWCDGD